MRGEGEEEDDHILRRCVVPRESGVGCDVAMPSGDAVLLGYWGGDAVL
jgi:hypothetical protein